jgi:hypothetical protein
MIFRLALLCFLEDGRLNSAEFKRFLRSICGENWVFAQSWRFEVPPEALGLSLPVIMHREERDALLASPTGLSRLIDEVELNAVQERQWRNLCFRRMPFPQPDGGHFPWEAVCFEVPDVSPAVLELIDAVAAYPWEVRGGVLTVCPADAMAILQMHSPETFKYRGRPPRDAGGAPVRAPSQTVVHGRVCSNRSPELVAFDTIDDLIAAIRRLGS